MLDWTGLALTETLPLLFIQNPTLFKVGPWLPLPPAIWRVCCMKTLPPCSTGVWFSLLVYADREKSIDGLARVFVCKNRERVYSVIIVNE
jgi:hypothetical protein